MTDSLYVRDTVNLFLFFTFFLFEFVFFNGRNSESDLLRKKWGTPERGDASHPSSLTVKTTSRVQERKKEKKRKVSLHSNGLTLKVEGKREKDSHRRWLGKSLKALHTHTHTRET